MDNTQDKKKPAIMWPWYLIAVAVIVVPWFFSSGFLFFTDYVWGPHLRLNWSEAPLWKNIFLWLADLVLSVPSVQKLYIAASLSVVLLGGRKIAATILDDNRLVFLVALFASRLLFY